MTDGSLSVVPVHGIGEIRSGDSLARAIVDACDLEEGDVVVVTSKIVSKAEGRLVPFDGTPSALLGIVARESARTLRRRGALVIAQTRHGFICASAGVDRSNVPEGTASLLPNDPDRSARRIRDGIKRASDRSVGVVVSDTFGRPWRKGVVAVALGVAGVAAVLDGNTEPSGALRGRSATEICVADELAAAAHLVMGRSSQTPAAIVRGVESSWFRRSSVGGEVVRAVTEDLFW
jgi:coenzyme F420-0:L-glutamate ligase/coenzyme F420-1:gamma-L-glutamate ligase